MNTAKLISKTTGVIPELRDATLEEQMAWVCRVSGDQRTYDAEKIIRYCLEHGHFSIFESVMMTLEIETSIAIFAQVVRHRSFTFQVRSARYAEVDVKKLEMPEMRSKSKNGNRQSSSVEDPKSTKEAVYPIDIACDEYNVLIEKGVAPECARMVLPQCMPTKAYMTGNIRSWIFYLTQRLDEHAQKEHRELAQSVFDIFEKECPTLADFLKNHAQRWAEKIG